MKFLRKHLLLFSLVSAALVSLFVVQATKKDETIEIEIKPVDYMSAGWVSYLC